MMDKIRRYFECYVHITICNLKCEYCYVRQFGRNSNEIATFKYSPEHISKALSIRRLGGVCYFNVCGAGETMMMPDLDLVVTALLNEGHWVSITTNGTYTQAYEQLLEKLNSNNCKHLHFAFSLHYLELKRKGWLGRFVENVKRVKDAGCSFVIQMNWYDGYDSVIDEIKDYCLDNFGSYPQIAATRLMEVKNSIELHTQKTREEYCKIAGSFNSPLFDFTMQNFLKPRKEFCYAGDWSGMLDLTDGSFRKCYGDRKVINIFEDVSKAIPFEAYGSHCHKRNAYCVNNSHFLSWGVIPELYDDITYSQLRNRPEIGWYTDEMKEFSSQKLRYSNEIYSCMRKIFVDMKEPMRWWSVRLLNKLHKIMKK